VAALRLAELRFNEGLTPEELGEKCNISGRTIRRLEDGAKPTPRVAKELADHFDVKASDIWPVSTPSSTEAAV
jgi:DNA-binding XRE family transcriptional regulator